MRDKLKISGSLISLLSSCNIYILYRSISFVFTRDLIVINRIFLLISCFDALQRRLDTLPAADDLVTWSGLEDALNGVKGERAAYRPESRTAVATPLQVSKEEEKKKMMYICKYEFNSYIGFFNFLPNGRKITTGMK